MQIRDIRGQSRKLTKFQNTVYTVICFIFSNTRLAMSIDSWSHALLTVRRNSGKFFSPPTRKFWFRTGGTSGKNSPQEPQYFLTLHRVQKRNPTDTDRQKECLDKRVTPGCHEFRKQFTQYICNNICANVYKTCYTIQLMHCSHFKTQSLQHLKPIKC